MMCSLLQIAPTIAKMFAIPLSSDAEPLNEVLQLQNQNQIQIQNQNKNNSDFRVVLIVIDSFDCNIFRSFASDFPEINALVDRGILLPCDTVSTHTTPAIASILTGLPPESHGITTENDVGKSNIDSILEIIDAYGFKTAAILEEKGAEPLKNRISLVFPVRDREDIMSYDSEVAGDIISALSDGAVMIFAHLRTIDRFAHRAYDMHVAARFTDAIVGHIVRAIRTTDAETILIMCGDHEAHTQNETPDEEARVPLIAVPLNTQLSSAAISISDKLMENHD